MDETGFDEIDSEARPCPAGCPFRASGAGLRAELVQRLAAAAVLVDGARRRAAGGADRERLVDVAELLRSVIDDLGPTGAS